MPTLSVVVGAGVGAAVTFMLTTCRWWSRRRRLARRAARRLVPELEAVHSAVSDALAAQSWQPLHHLEPSDHSLPALTRAVADGLPPRVLDPLIDGVLAVIELDAARESMSLAEPQVRDRVGTYQRRIEGAAAVAAAVSARRSIASA